MAADLEHVRQIVDRVAGSSGLEVVEVEFKGAGKARMLRIFIDKPGGVTHADCEFVSREVGTILDVEDVIPGDSYVLEVSSPGLDRKLSKPADFEKFRGSLVKVSTFEPVDGNRHFEGKLEQFADGRLTLQLSGGKKPKKNAPVPPPKAVTIEFRNVAKANLVPEI